ncbi:ABC transporter ATP-binding protein [Deinococcus metallilatus]|uniref:Putative hemin import ATP-binding protein HrtA n=2 Tax=Deinococcus metallilatus TaxID=1211322 RepID=A0ABR6MR65_9DEIO|nr:ABC transporter ATP-binding protein [Deinococcus metallilatus]MBB5294442.1 putative ABC transport system ATP-binding protein [Deinococcus metallilatus]GMA15658.1 ABC transporter ATP-binding protein [Deinococcus metallilatus]
MTAILETPRPFPQAANSMTPILSLRNVSKTYGDGEGTITALHPATLEVRPGELVAVNGPSGSGKSTFLSIAGALLRPTSGQVVIAGQDVTALPQGALPAFRLEHLGFVLQSSNLIPYLTMREQLTLVPRLAGSNSREAARQADELLRTLGLLDRARHYPDALSGGQRQRVAIARALMNDPALILADEPTASLDGTRGREVVRMLAREVHEWGKAAVMVTHDERVLDLCDRVVQIVDGRLSG